MKNFCLKFFLVSITYCVANSDSNFPCNGVPNSVWIANPDSCIKSYYCLNGVAHSVSCPNELYFDEELQVCTYPEDVDCNNGIRPSGRICQNSGLGWQRYPNSCTWYYICCGRRELLQTCADGLHFSLETNQCTWPNLANCNLITEESEEVTDPVPDITDPKPDVTDPPIIKPFECPTNLRPGEVVFLPSTTNCNQYYMCRNNERILMECAPGLHFDTSLNTCNLESIANCIFGNNGQGSSEDIIEPKPDILQPFECPSNLRPGEVVFLPSTINCNQYYLCRNNERILMNCAEGLHFDTSINRCNLASVANCIYGRRNGN